MRCPLPTKMAGLNLALGRAGVWVPLYCTLKQLTESVLIHLGLFSQSEQMKSERLQSLTHSRKRKTYDLNATDIYEQRNGQCMFWRASVSCGMDYVWRLHAADINENGRCVVTSCCWTGREEPKYPEQEHGHHALVTTLGAEYIIHPVLEAARCHL